jgi:hypothetical protein
MSEPAPRCKADENPPTFEQFRDFASKLINVPKSEADKKEKEWREERKRKKTKSEAQE